VCVIATPRPPIRTGTGCTGSMAHSTLVTHSTCLSHTGNACHLAGQISDCPESRWSAQHRCVQALAQASGGDDVASPLSRHVRTRPCASAHRACKYRACKYRACKYNVGCRCVSVKAVVGHIRCRQCALTKADQSRRQGSAGMRRARFPRAGQWLPTGHAALRTQHRTGGPSSP